MEFTVFSTNLKTSSLAAMIVAVTGLSSLPQDVHASSADRTTLANVISGSDTHTLHGYRKLVSRPNYAGRVVRTLDSSAVPANLAATQSLLAFGHMSDTQICDDQSPARVPFMDKRNDVDPSWDTGAAYRPQERLLPQMGAAMVSSLRNLGAGPATNLSLAFTLITGDMIDNAQYNETRWYIDMMDGGVIRPNNATNPNAEEGPGYGRNDTGHKYNMPDWSYYSTKPSAYYHPNGAKPYPDSPPDWYRQQDFPVVPNLLSASRRNFVSPGLGMPWYAAFGNHDMSIQGNLPAGTTLGNWAKAKATQNERIREVDAPWDKPSGYLDWAGAIAGSVLSGNPTYEAAATADPNRRVLDKSQFMDEHFATTGQPVGHGFNSSGKPYYVMPSSGPNDRFKFIALDTTNSNGFGAGGWIDHDQWHWLLQELKSASTRYWDDGRGWVVNPEAKDKLIVLYGHHTLDSMDKITKSNGLPIGYTGAELERLLLRFPNVILLVNGHTHKNSIRGHWINRAGLPKGMSGFWEVTSPAAADFPVQSRVIEVGLGSTGIANGVPQNDYLSIYTTMLDIDAPASFDPNASMADFRQLASAGRELSYNDPGDRTGSQMLGWRAGEASDRNTQLTLPTPFPMNDFPLQGDRGTHIVTQKWDSKDVKILKIGINGNLLSAADHPAASLQNSEVIGTGQFTQGLKMGQDLVLKDAAGNIRIKLLDMSLKETPYPGFGDSVRGTVAATTTLSGIADFNGDGRSDLLWRRQNGLSEIWFSGSSADRKYLDYDNDNDRSEPAPGSENWNVTAVGDFNGDAYPDLQFENTQNHTLAVWYMRGATRIGDSYPPNWPYNQGYQPARGLVGNVLVESSGDHQVYRKLAGSEYGQVMVADPDSVWSQVIYYQNITGWNSNTQWTLMGLGDFNVDSRNDILWRHLDGSFAIWFLNGATYHHDIWLNVLPVDTGWKYRGLLKNTMGVIY